MTERQGMDRQGFNYNCCVSSVCIMFEFLNVEFLLKILNQSTVQLYDNDDRVTEEQMYSIILLLRCPGSQTAM